MKYPIRTLLKYHIAYGLMPFKRNQDVIRVHELDGGGYVLAVADGWNRPDVFPGEEPGRAVAQIVAKEYPKIFLSLSIADPRKQAFTASERLDERIAKKYPRLATAVAVFVFHLNHEDIVVSVGDERHTSGMAVNGTSQKKSVIIGWTRKSMIATWLVFLARVNIRGIPVFREFLARRLML